LIIPSINTGVWNSLAYVIIPPYMQEYNDKIGENIILLVYSLYGVGECIASGFGMYFYL
jgi:hypothetical protein